MGTKRTLHHGKFARNVAGAALGLGAISAASGTGMMGCGPSRLPAPTYAPQRTGALGEIPYPPPPARVEIVPERPDLAGIVWLDGEWTWQGRRWAWKHGRWVVAPAGWTFAPWTVVRDERGVLYLASGVFLDARGTEMTEPAPIASARTTSAAVVDATGQRLPTSNVNAPRAPRTQGTAGLADAPTSPARGKP